MLDLSGLKPGLKGTANLIVGPEHTAPRVGSGRIAVLATPVLINLIEAAALDCCEQLLPPGHQSLGIHLDVRHFAATPVGMRVTATAELIKVDKTYRDVPRRCPRREGSDQRWRTQPRRGQRFAIRCARFSRNRTLAEVIKVSKGRSGNIAKINQQPARVRACRKLCKTS